MKKLISILMLLVILLNGVAFAEDEFSFFSGVKFGMTRSQVKGCFSGLNVELAEQYTGGLAENLRILYAKVATYDDIIMRTYFDENNTLYVVKYEFYDDKLEEYLDFEALLTAKYGSTEFSDETNTRIYSQKGAILYKRPLTEFNDEFGRPIEDKVIKFSQRLFNNKDGSGVFLEHIISYSNITQMNSHRVCYKYLTPDEMCLFETSSVDLSGF